jgi:hypothetical protein
MILLVDLVLANLVNNFGKLGKMLKSLYLRAIKKLKKLRKPPNLLQKIEVNALMRPRRALGIMQMPYVLLLLLRCFLRMLMNLLLWSKMRQKA